ncbi:MAG TPA: DUF4215 domain-containing protein [Thermoanaerobaculaceae bacterium]|nr:DUF4215 domain-containing protein [Thermoanaerobaculaceae bacterium]HPS77657.1 DUF4215 domain-containing protein [Thermoanaerobaculaceae bacterium]
MLLHKGSLSRPRRIPWVLIALTAFLLHTGLANPQVCGDGVVAGSEQCDDFNTDPGDGCSATCGIESGWSCIGQPSVCTPAILCGDGIISGSEQCDDFNTAPGDGCSATCDIESGWSCTSEPSVCTHTCSTCDVTCDGTTNVGDVFYLINSLFAGGPDPTGPGDCNADGTTNVSDVFYLINFLFAGGPAPA